MKIALRKQIIHALNVEAKKPIRHSRRVFRKKKVLQWQTKEKVINPGWVIVFD